MPYPRVSSSEHTDTSSCSRKIYIRGSRDDLRVGMCEIEQDDTPISDGVEKNPPITDYV